MECWRPVSIRDCGASAARVLSIIVLVELLSGAAPEPPRREVGDVLRNFETICLTDMQTGYSLEIKLFIEKAGYKFASNNRGYDIFNSNIGQLIIGDTSCSMGMPGLDFTRMWELTKPWAERHGFERFSQATSTSGGQRWEGYDNGDAVQLALEENKFPDGMALTGLIVGRRASQTNTQAPPSAPLTGRAN